MKVLHGPVNVGNQPWVLSRYERQLGLTSELVVNYHTWLNYSVDRCLSSYAQRNISSFFRRLAFGVSAPFRYDVFHYYFGRTFLCWDDYGSPTPLWFADMKLAKRLGKKVFATFQGCDARIAQASHSNNHVTFCAEGHCTAFSYCLAQNDACKKNAVRQFIRYADRIFYLNPELGRDIPGASFLPYANMEMQNSLFIPPALNGPIRIVHAPSDPAIKGTGMILATIEKLKKNHPVEVLLVQGLPHKEALKIYQAADLVIDQVLAGWYGGLAVEVMAMGKPVIAYIRDEDLAVIPEAMRRELPVLSATPATLPAVLTRAMEQRGQWREWAERSYQYARKWHNPNTIAKAMRRAYMAPDSHFDLSTHVREASCAE